ncbi:DUF4442 domain-containing protein [Crocinitomix catalasitica]|uniref:DUF4442 domain-containing protein n=1 Tax=Crocinitomix catalasitica TaxID=184607 RepID=UPI0004870EB8|nr:DUF4442 domain-containing protein [Crocinitomix catalasitica]
MNFEKYIVKAKDSKFSLWLLNLGLGYMIPFNKPHRIKVKQLWDNKIETIIPYRRKNMNHIRGVHACGMATAAEFSSGFLILTKIGNDKYRLIMESLEMKYHYQAKTDIIARFEIEEDWLLETVVKPLEKTDKIMVTCQIELYDLKDNHVATGKTNWQIKAWDKVKTKLS